MYTKEPEWFVYPDICHENSELKFFLTFNQAIFSENPVTF